MVTKYSAQLRLLSIFFFKLRMKVCVCDQLLRIYVFSMEPAA